MKRRLSAVVVTLGIVLTACASSGAPETFADQLGPLSEDMSQFAADLIGDGDPDLVPLVQRNFFEGCMTQETERVDGLSGAALARACGCSYDGLVQFLRDNTVTETEAFDRFKDLSDSLKDDGAPLSGNFSQIFEDCQG